MGFYDRSKQIVITRNLGVDKWAIVEPNGSHVPMSECPAAMKAGEVIAHVATKISTEIQIGILSEVFGPAVKRVYGEVVWLTPEMISASRRVHPGKKLEMR